MTQSLKPPAPPDGPIEISSNDLVEISEVDEIIEIESVKELPLQAAAPAPLILDLDEMPITSSVAPSRDVSVPQPLLTPLAAGAPQPPLELSLPDLPQAPTTAPPEQVGMGSPAPPLLMDDVPTASFDIVEPHSPRTFVPEPPAAAVDLDALPDLQAVELMNPAAPKQQPAALAGVQLRYERSGKKAGKGRLRLVLAAAAMGLAGGAAVIFMTPLERTLGLVSPPPPPPPPVVVARPEKPAPPPPPQEPLPVATVETVTAANVDTANYPSLLAAARGPPAAADAGARDWARFRLAWGFEDEAAISWLRETSSQKLTGHESPLSLAALLATAELWGKLPQQKKIIAKLHGAAARTPQVLFAEAVVSSRQNKAKALEILAHVLTAAPNMTEAALLQGQLGLQGKTRAEAVRGLLQVARQGDPDTIARVAKLALNVHAYDILPELLEPLGEGKLVVTALPQHRNLLWNLLLCRFLQRNDNEAAQRVAFRHLRADANDGGALVQLLRLVRYDGASPEKLLEDGVTAMHDPQAQARVYYDALQAALLQKNAGATETYRQKLLALPPTEAIGWVKMAEAALALNSGDKASARQIYSSLAAQLPNFEEPRVAFDLLADVGQPRLDKIKQWVEDSGAGPARLALAQALVDSGDFGGASEQFEALAWSHPTEEDPVELQLRWIDALSRSNQAEKATQLVERLLHSRPTDDRPALQAIVLAEQSKRWDAAIAYYKALLGRHPNHRKYTILLAHDLINAGQHKEAIATLDALAKVDPVARDAEFLYTEGRAYGAQDVVRARSFLLESIKHTANPRAYVLLGELEQNRGKQDEALDAYKHALALDPQQPIIALRMIRILVTKGFIQDAIGKLVELTNQFPHNSEALELLGDAWREQGDNKAAVAAYEKAVEQQPGNSALLMKLGRLQLQELGQTQLASRWLRQLVALEPQNAEAHYYLGMALKDLGQPRQARPELGQYLKLAPQGEFASEVHQTLEDIKR